MGIWLEKRNHSSKKLLRKTEKIRQKTLQLQEKSTALRYGTIQGNVKILKHIAPRNLIFISYNIFILDIYQFFHIHRLYIHYCLYLFALRGFIVDDWFLSNFSWKQSTQNDSIKYKVKTLTVPKIIQMEKTVPWKLEGQSWQTISYPAAQKWRASNHQLQPISTLQGIAKIKHYMFIIPILQYTHIWCI